MLTKNVDKCLSSKPKFSIDEACLDIINAKNVDVEVYGQYTECDTCDFQNLATIPAHTNTSLLINTKYSLQMYYVENGSSSCRYI